MPLWQPETCFITLANILLASFNQDSYLDENLSTIEQHSKKTGPLRRKKSQQRGLCWDFSFSSLDEKR